MTEFRSRTENFERTVRIQRIYLVLVGTFLDFNGDRFRADHGFCDGRLLRRVRYSCYNFRNRLFELLLQLF